MKQRASLNKLTKKKVANDQKMVASDKQNDRITHPKKKCSPQLVASDNTSGRRRQTIKLVNNKSFFLHYQSMNVNWQKQNYIKDVTFLFFLGGGRVSIHRQPNKSPVTIEKMGG